MAARHFSHGDFNRQSGKFKGIAVALFLRAEEGVGAFYRGAID
jgi:hypothetical protein